VGQSDWYILEINELGETASYPELIAALQSIFGHNVEFFIPIYHEQMGSYVSTSVLFEGYIFVKDSEEVRANQSNIKGAHYFSGFLKMGGKIQTLSSREIGILRRKLKNSLNKKIRAGVKVKVHEGTFQNLVGEVLSLENEGRIANIKIVCLSREIIAPIPTTCIEEII
jgi:transcription antitermination factor NusG